MINKINKILNNLKVEKNIIQKSNKLFGIKGTTKYDNKDIVQSVKLFVLEAPYNVSLYKAFVEAGLFQKFMKDDLVHWYKQYPPKDNFELDTNRIDKITSVGYGIIEGFKYQTEEVNHKDGITPRVGGPYENYIKKCGISPYIRFKTLGKDKEALSSLDGLRYFELAKQELKNLVLPKEHTIMPQSTSWYGGYSLGNLTYSFCLVNKDDDFEKTNKLSCEIRFHIRSLNDEKLSATLWLNWNNKSLNKNIDLFQGDNYNDRFIYADNFKELFEICLATLNPLIQKYTDENGLVVDYFK